MIPVLLKIPIKFASHLYTSFVISTSSLISSTVPFTLPLSPSHQLSYLSSSNILSFPLPLCPSAPLHTLCFISYFTQRISPLSPLTLPFNIPTLPLFFFFSSALSKLALIIIQLSHISINNPFQRPYPQPHLSSTSSLYFLSLLSSHLLKISPSHLFHPRSISNISIDLPLPTLLLFFLTAPHYPFLFHHHVSSQKS